jgi:hypothetical protein
MELTANIEPPNNESSEHFYLKQVAKIWLKTQKQCQYVASEIYLPGGRHEGRECRSISDAVGVKKTHIRGSEYHYTICNIEVKVSKTDFLAGYCVGGHFNWLMTPMGLLEPNLLPKEVGLIEVDINDFVFNEGLLQGIGVAKKARKLHNETSGTYIIDSICRQLTNQDVYNNPWVKIKEGIL